MSNAGASQHKRFRTNKGRIRSASACSGGRRTSVAGCYYPQRGHTQGVKDWRKLKAVKQRGRWTYRFNGAAQRLNPFMKMKIHLDKARIAYHSGLGMIRKYGPFADWDQVSGLPPGNPTLKPGYRLVQERGLTRQKRRLAGAGILDPLGQKGWRKYYSRGQTYIKQACEHLEAATKLWGGVVNTDDEDQAQTTLSPQEIDVLDLALPRVDDLIDRRLICGRLLARLPTGKQRRPPVREGISPEELVDEMFADATGGDVDRLLRTFSDIAHDTDALEQALIPYQMVRNHFPDASLDDVDNLLSFMEDAPFDVALEDVLRDLPQ